jgi:lambda family phage portal protein
MWNPLKRILKFAYDAVDESRRRKNAFPLTRSEDAELLPEKRRRLVAGARDLPRNFSVAAWALRKHLDYVSTFRFKSQSGNPEVDNEVENLIRWWSRPINCDVAGRHSLPRMVRLLESSRTIDGDVFLNMLSDGHLQAIEGDRVCNPIGGIPTDIDVTRLVHGVLTDDFGKAIAYTVCDRPRLNKTGLQFSKLLSASYTRHLAYYSRFDQVRGVSLMAPAINCFRDVYENIGYALAKAKVSQLFAFATFRDADEAYAPVQKTESDEDGDGVVEPRYSIGFDGPQILDLEPGDDAKVIESQTPSTQFQAFMQEVIPLGLKALDIPASFYDEGRANFSSGRQAWLLYDQSANSKREDLREVLDFVTAWRLKLFINSGDLVLPRGFAIRDLRWDWVSQGVPWVDPLKEAAADTMQINAGLNSRQRLCKQRGEDYFEIVDELAEEAAYAAEKKVVFKDTPMTVNIGAPDAQQGAIQ